MWPIKFREMSAQEVMGKIWTLEKKRWGERECPPPSYLYTFLCEAMMCSATRRGNPKKWKKNWPRILELLSYWINQTWRLGIHLLLNFVLYEIVNIYYLRAFYQCPVTCGQTKWFTPHLFVVCSALPVLSEFQCFNK